jgi:hypothetical protein
MDLGLMAGETAGEILGYAVNRLQGEAFCTFAVNNPTDEVDKVGSLTTL